MLVALAVLAFAAPGGRAMRGPALAGGGVRATTAGGRASTAANSPVLSFHSAPGLHPPRMALTRDRDRTSGDIFLAPLGSPQQGPLILGSQGSVIWFRPLSAGEAALNVQVQTYRDRHVLTWWRGRLVVGGGTIYGRGRDVIMDSSYRTVAVVRAGHGYAADLHEFQITPQGTALLDAYVPVHRNLTSLGGPSNATVLDCVIQEVNVRTGSVLWEWHSLDHVPLSASYWPVPKSSSSYFDYFHINSIQQLPGGNLLVSARNTWSIYEISRRTGKVIWTLGGKCSNFTMGRGARFEWQHDARLHPGGILSLFDDASAPQEESQSAAKVLRIDTKAMTARLEDRYTHSPPVLAGLAGNTQLLPNHSVFVGWGGSPDFSEYAPGGRQIFNGSFALGVLSYRALRFPWTGRPRTPPAVATATASRSVTVYASWNGATQVVRWRVLGGARRGALHVLVHGALRRGFETRIRVRGRPHYVAVQALGARGRVLGTSRVTATR
jgi:hypothetical protein